MLDKTIPLKSIDKSVDAISATADAGVDQFNNIVNSVKKIVPAFDGEMVQKVKNRILSNQKSASSEVEAFFTKDQKLLNQYYALRHEVYRNENGWMSYNGMENEFDRKGDIVVSIKDDKVIGGMRIMFSDECEFLSNEIPGTEFNYKRLIQKYDKRENILIIEFSALVADRNHRDGSVFASMIEAVIKKYSYRKPNYLFSVANVIVCRNDRMTAKRLGYEVEIMMSVTWKQREEYNFSRMFPIYLKLF